MLRSAPANTTKQANLFVVAYRGFPRTFLVKVIGHLLPVSLLVYNYLVIYGIETILERVLITAVVVTTLPVFLIYLVTLVRVPFIRQRKTIADAELQHIAQDNQRALLHEEQKVELEVVRLEQVASDDKRARDVKDEQEDQRWSLLNEVLRAQDASGQQSMDERAKARKELASDELLARQIKDRREDDRWSVLNEKLRIQQAAGQQTEDLKEERETVRQQLATVDLKAQEVKEIRDSARWENLNEQLRAQNITADDRSLANKHLKDLQNERDATRRKEVATVEAQAQQRKETREDDRWDALHKRLQAQEERSEQRDRDQSQRHVEYLRMREADHLLSLYEKLYRRYQRYTTTLRGTDASVEDGDVAMPAEWLLQQPELRRTPELLEPLRSMHRGNTTL